MLCLCVDLSSDSPSVALGADHDLLDVRTWSRADAPRQAFFQAWNQLLSRHGFVPDAVTDLWVGLGPGNYTGLRTALAAAQAFALPGGRVYGVSSAAITAFAAVENRPGTDRVSVFGDARGGYVWRIDFRRDPLAGVVRENDVCLKRNGEHVLACDDSVLVWQGSASVALLSFTGEEKPTPVVLAHPEAGALWRLCSLRLLHGIASEPLVPLYVRPPVS